MKNLLGRICLLFVLALVGICVVPIVNADSPSWVPLTPLPSPVASQVGYVYNNTLISLSGAITFDIPNQYISLVDGSGNFSSWQTSSSLDLYWHAFALSSDKVYVLGGANYPPTTYKNTVYMKDIDPNISSWIPLTPLPVARGVGRSVIVNNLLYFAGGYDDHATYDDIYVAPIQSDGSIGNWSIAGHLPTTLNGFGFYSQGNKVIVIGGRQQSATMETNAVWIGTVDPATGIITSWTSGPSLPVSVGMFQTTRIDNTIFVLGGTNYGSLLNAVYYTTIANDGTLSSWQTSLAPLPVGTCCGVGLSLNNYLYILGGVNTIDGYTSAVYKATVSDVAPGVGTVTPTPTPTDTPTPTLTDTPTPSPTLTPTPTATPTPVLSLMVPLLKQTSNPWGGQTYDRANLWSPLHKTISDWGCALTSAVMVLNYHGYLKLPDGQQLNPSTLNTWLTQQSDGYVGDGWVNWLAISRLTKSAKAINKTSFDALEYFWRSSFQPTLLTLDLVGKQPDIIDVGGHFVVATGILANTFTINDPYFARETLAVYTSPAQMGRYRESNTDLSYIMFTYDPSLEIHVATPGGTIGEGILQQPLQRPGGGETNGSPLGIYYVQQPVGQNYTVTVTSTKPQDYTLKLYAYDQEGNVQAETVQGVVGNNQSDVHTVVFNKQNSKKTTEQRQVTLQVLLSDIQNEIKLGHIHFLVRAPLRSLAQLAVKSKNPKETARILHVIDTFTIGWYGKHLMSDDARKLIHEDVLVLFDQMKFKQPKEWDRDRDFDLFRMIRETHL